MVNDPAVAPWLSALKAQAYDVLWLGRPVDAAGQAAVHEIEHGRTLTLDVETADAAPEPPPGEDVFPLTLSQMELPHGSVRVAICAGLLPRLPTVEAARDVVSKLVLAARDYAIIRQPCFDADAGLLAMGLRTASADAAGRPNPMSSYDIWRAASCFIESGEVDLHLLGRGPITSLQDAALTSLLPNAEAERADEALAFAHPVYKELIAILVKRDAIAARVDWRRIASALQHDGVIAQFVDGKLVAQPRPRREAAAPPGAKESKPVEASVSPGRKYLFLCGVARSGTTVLTSIVNAHPKIAVGVERYKTLSSGGQEPFDPSLFEKERFFDMRDTDTNVAMPGVYARLAAKYDRCVYFGDKVPRYYRKIDKILATFPAAKVVFISRDIQSVAFSWNARADNPEDSWPADNDFRVAVGEWNAANRIALAAVRQRPDQVAVVNYEALVGQGFEPTQRLIHWLGLGVSDHFRRAYERIAARAPAKKVKQPKPGQEDFIAAKADYEVFKALQALAL